MVDELVKRSNSLYFYPSTALLPGAKRLKVAGNERLKLESSPGRPITQESIDHRRA